MKKIEIENIINNLTELKKFSNNLDYNTSVVINKTINNIIPVLNKEYQRMDDEKITINCPRYIFS